MAEYHQQEVPWVRIKIFRSRFWKPAGVHDGYIGQQVIINQPIVVSQWKPCLFCIFLLASTHAHFMLKAIHSCFSKCVSDFLERKGNFWSIGCFFSACLPLHQTVLSKFWESLGFESYYMSLCNFILFMSLQDRLLDIQSNELRNLKIYLTLCVGLIQTTNGAQECIWKSYWSKQTAKLPTSCLSL